MGPAAVRTTGQVKGRPAGNRDDRRGGGATKTSIPWSADIGGPFAAEQSLLRKPMQPGERRKLKMLDGRIPASGRRGNDGQGRSSPASSAPARTTCCASKRSLDLPTARSSNRRIWTDRTGDTLKTLMPAMGSMETYRVSKAEALEKADAAELDLLSSMMVKVEPPLSGGHQTKEVRYRVHLDGSDPASVFVTGPTQAVKSIDANTAEVTVYAIRPGQSGRQSQRAGRSADGRRSAAERFRAERRSADRGRREEGRRRRERPVARGGGA